MSIAVGWYEIALRILCALVAGAVIGINRGRRGQAAGMRTTMLVSLAACLSMIQVNLLLGVEGKISSSFIVMDPMRLPLGVLSGMGFIGAGSILRRDNVVVGVTTAATLWFVTVVGLCLGAGHIGLGMASVALGWVILEGLHAFENKLTEDVQA